MLHAPPMPPSAGRSPMSQVRGSLLSISVRPMTYQTQAIQWASRANMEVSSVSTMALYCE